VRGKEKGERRQIVVPWSILEEESKKEGFYLVLFETNEHQQFFFVRVM